MHHLVFDVQFNSDFSIFAFYYTVSAAIKTNLLTNTNDNAKETDFFSSIHSFHKL